MGPAGQDAGAFTIKFTDSTGTVHTCAIDPTVATVQTCVDTPPA